MNRTVDVLIPVANGIEFLFESVQSVVQQTYTDWNCWIVLNGSGLTLEGQVIATSVAAMDPRIHVLKIIAIDKCEALNAAVKHMKAPWIALLDVDDRWHPTKLATQMAVATDEMAVIGTHTAYFGEFSGSPQIPTGWIDPTVLPTVNPLINSSVLIRRELANWTYGPDGIAKNMEDYLLWMELTLKGHRFYNCSEILTDHRIHRQSAFNSQHRSPVPLQNWYRNQFISRLRILTIATSQPQYIQAQYKALQKHLQEPFEFIVFNDAKSWADASNFGDSGVRSKISQMCSQLSIRCVNIENSHHMHMTSPSHRHCDALRHVMDFIQKEGAGRYWMLDSDMFPITDISSDKMANYFAKGAFVQQRRTVGNTEVVYGWPNLWWIDTSAVNYRGLSWDLAPECDTGGASAAWFKGKDVSWITHLASGSWSLSQLPTSLQGHQKLVEFLTHDPRNQQKAINDQFDTWMECEIYDDCLLHLRAGSNWRNEGRSIHDILLDHVSTLFLK